MIFLYLFVVATVACGLGIYVGARLRNNTYHGAIFIQESPEGKLVYRLEFAGDPEMMVFEDSVTFKVIPPDYEELMSRGKRGV